MSKIEIEVKKYTLNDTQISLLAEEFFGHTLEGLILTGVLTIEFENEMHQKSFKGVLEKCFAAG